MGNQQFLEYEIVLLIAKYGEKRVLSALAGKLCLSPEEIGRKLKELKELKPRVIPRKQADTSRLVESVITENPLKANNLRLLFARFQNKTFLSELKEVKRFFDRHSHNIGRVKSRADAAPRLFKLLASLELAELASLCDESGQKEHSSLGIISDEIMRRGK